MKSTRGREGITYEEGQGGRTFQHFYVNCFGKKLPTATTHKKNRGIKKRSGGKEPETKKARNPQGRGKETMGTGSTRDQNFTGHASSKTPCS